MSDNQFATLGLKESIVRAISDLGFTKPSQIQEQSIPVTLSGADLIGQAQTGTGKTAAYSLPILTKMSTNKGIKALILAPTRELAVQVKDEMNRLSKYEKAEILAVYGGDSIDRQIRALRKGVDVVVGTPGRMLDLIKRKCLHLDSVEFLVLDEADEMLNMGFIDDIESILSHTPEERQTLLFSATMPDPIAKLAKRYMKPDAKLVSVKKSSLTVSKIEQSYFMINNKHRLEALCRLLDLDNPSSAIIFCRTKRGVDELVQELQSKGYMVEGMHGDMTQAHRLTTLSKFKEGTLNLLIATDVAARGIDVDGVTHVFNYDLPQDVESYVHRIGRTGRANREGTAYSLVTPKDFSMLKQIQKVTKSAITQKPVPTAEEIKNKKFNDIIKEVTETITSGDLAKFMPNAIELVENNDPLSVVAALMKIKYDNESVFDYSSDKLEAPKKEDIRLFFSVGKRDGLTPKVLINYIKDRTRVNASTIGQIDLMENFSFVSVDETVSKKILDKCPGGKINKKKVNVEVANRRKK
ncbi:DEAD/DEAH box helicase [Clostridium butyricum]|uniref:ATP-dependent RNA helicase CshA n=1 Tax=Clostridium butyricum E4 str. BoNT E BL5262 TaxID=632245 RepID=C4IN47_CLOBU|nr:DEAD/DEAH box helicase [Clostridium butyricum]APF21897.1 DEAD/DEAH box helicase family protein [Clostridium butyricum]EDT75004.1 ATP-dependent RNA helicase DbpA [Clostridium butyricum 5521]EEP52334.1 cold-shock deAd box protein a [Clostridium butyricum E4 str. BoNT E BL5262]NFL33393.1 DEAD/DEAH box helicase [Clostridium butyricum]NFS19148.1 DEAD/DEAH box helicase [Clostridium butyricum]